MNEIIEPITMDEVKHEYYRNRNDEKIRYLSVTKILGLIDPFDRQYQLARKALKIFIFEYYSSPSWFAHLKRGNFANIDQIRDYLEHHKLKPEYIKIYKQLDAEWKQANEKGCSDGTQAHDDLELFNKKYEKNCYVKDVFGKFKSVKYIETTSFHAGDFCQEFLMYNDEYEISGKPDKCVFFKKENDNAVYFNLGDYKTNKDGLEKSAFKNQTFLYPLNHILNNKLNLYSLQTVLYAYMIECFGYKCNDIEIEWVDINSKNPITGIYNNIIRYSVDYQEVKPHVIRLLDWYFMIKNDLDEDFVLPKNFKREVLHDEK